VGLYEYLTVVRWRWRFFALFVTTVVGAVTLLAALMTPQYTTKATVYFVAQKTVSNADPTEAVLYPGTLVRSYAEAATTPLLLNQVIEQLDLEMSAATLADTLDVNSPLGTVIIEIEATDPSAAQDARIANAVARQLVRAADGKAAGSALADPALRASTIAPAGVPKDPTQPKKALMPMVALGWAVPVGAAVCIWLARIDPRIRSRSDVANCTPAPLLGYLPREPGRWERFRLDPQRNASASRAQWEQLRANFAILRDGGTLTSTLFVAAVAERQPNRVVAHLSGSLLATGARVLLINADLRAGQATESHGLGLSSVLRGECQLRDAVIQLPDQPATLPAGPRLSDPSAALGSTEMAGLLRAAEADYDVVLILAAPLLASPEALALSQVVDGVVLVGDQEAMRRDYFGAALAALARAGGRVRAVVLCSPSSDSAAAKQT
jgi:succinoglycan biosynthesis transport protein ExoP